jgi:hypothetical protein
MAIIGYPTEIVAAEASYPEWTQSTYVHELRHTLGAPRASNGDAGELAARSVNAGTNET